MKKLLLIPTLTTIGLTPLVSLASCQEDISIYQVPEEEMEDIIRLKDVVYLQTHKVVVGEGYPDVYDCEYSPFCFHSIRTRLEETLYYEKIVTYNIDGSYTKYTRHKPTDTKWDISHNVSPETFETVSNVAEANWHSFSLPSIYEASYVFDKKNKCYSATFYLEKQVLCTHSFYFKNKKLIRIREETNGQMTFDSTFKYDEYTPQPPTI